MNKKLQFFETFTRFWYCKQVLERYITIYRNSLRKNVGYNRYFLKNIAL